jgi:hypothetical protein
LCKSLGKGSQEGNVAGARSHRNVLLTILLVISLCLFMARAVKAEGPIRVLSSTTRNNFPVELFFDIAVADDASDIDSIELVFRRRGEPSETVARLDFTPGRQVEASYRWYTENVTVPPSMPIEYHWVIVDQAGNRLRTEPQTVYYDDVRFAWHVLENKDVAVFWYAGGEDVGHNLFDSAVAALQRLSAATEARVEYPIRIVVYGNEEDFRSAFPYLNEWVGGHAFARAALIVGYAEPGKPSLTWTLEQVIPHEISHILFYQATSHPYSNPPRWLNEGLAMHNEDTSHDDAIALVWEAVQRGQLLSLAQISGSFPPDEYVAALSYAESLSVVQFILERYGAKAMAAFLQAFKEGKTTDEAITHAFGLSLEDFEDAWKEYLAQLPLPAEPDWPPLPVRGPRRSLFALLVGGLLCCGVALFAILLTLGLVLSRRSRT